MLFFITAFLILAVMFILNKLYITEVEVRTLTEYDFDIPDHLTFQDKKELLEKKAKEYYGKGYILRRGGYNSVKVSKKKIKWGTSRSIRKSGRQETLNIIIGWLGVILLTTFIITTMIKVGHKSQYLQKQNEYEILLVQIERIQENNEDYILNGDFGSLEDVYDGVKEYNNWVISNQYWSDNIWFSYFANKYANDLEIIEL